MMPHESVIHCESKITQVTVHCRGALVTRNVILPTSLPSGDIVICLSGITLLCEASGIRASALGDGRKVVAVRTSLEVPQSGALLAEEAESLRLLSAQIDRLKAEHAHVQTRREALLNATLAPTLRVALAKDALGARFQEALSCANTLHEVTKLFDLRLANLEAALGPLHLKRDALALEQAQRSSTERKGAGHPSRRILVHLSPSITEAGATALSGLEVSYVVMAARFWPLYTLRLSDAGRNAEFHMEALVAQRTGEDWRGASLALSTADLILDARLPELPSLRFGRAQTPPKRGYRPPPEGLERMYAGYDRAFFTPLPPPSIEPVPSALPETEESLDEDSGVERAKKGSFRHAEKRAKEEAPMRKRAAPKPVIPPPAAMQAMAPGAPPQAVPAPARSRGFGAALGEMARGGSADFFAPAVPMMEDGASEGMVESPNEEPASLEPGKDWLDFDGLRLLPPSTQGAERGKLSRKGEEAQAEKAQARSLLEELAPLPSLRDPMASRGLFDHRYEAEGLATVPADGLPHRVALGVARSEPELRLRVVPREIAQAYREVLLTNPFPAPLLSGPVDVYVEGSLLAKAEIEHIDRGGTLTVGMGVEERVRVARNARVEEETTGVLGGSTAVTHTVQIEITSALPQKAQIEVIDRVPVSDDKAVEIKRLFARPEPEVYKQTERGQPLRGGLLFRLQLAPGAKALVEFQYRVTLPSKCELVGGNRRE